MMEWVVCINLVNNLLHKVCSDWFEFVEWSSNNTALCIQKLKTYLIKEVRLFLEDLSIKGLELEPPGKAAANQSRGLRGSNVRD